MATCHFCAEEIMDAATVCKHCGRELPSITSPAPTAATTDKRPIRYGSSLTATEADGAFAEEGAEAQLQALNAAGLRMGSSPCEHLPSRTYTRCSAGSISPTSRLSRKPAETRS